MSLQQLMAAMYNTPPVSSGGGSSNTAYTGLISVNSSGRLVNGLNGTGNPIMLRGIGACGLDAQDIQGYHHTNPWGSAGGLPIGLAGPPFPIAANWKCNSVRIHLQAQCFLGQNFGILNPSWNGGSATTPTWSGCVATAASSGTTVTVGSTAVYTNDWVNGGTGNPGPVSTNYGPYVYLINVTNPAGVPGNTQILSTTATTFTVNQACTIANGDVLTVVRAASSSGLYITAMKAAIANARLNNLYIILEFHAGGPIMTLPVVGTTTNFSAHIGSPAQPYFMDYDSYYPAWCDPNSSLPAWLNANYGPSSGNYNSKYGPSGFGDIIFELFNEPTTDDAGTYTTTGGSSITGVVAMRNGGICTNGWFDNGKSYYGNGVGMPYGGEFGTWQVLGYQQAVTAIRGMGYTNIIQCNGGWYASQIQKLGSFMPTDTLSPIQLAVGWHPYEIGTTNSPQTTDGYGYAMFPQAQAIIAGTAPQSLPGYGAPLPIIITECGDSPSSGNFNGPGTPMPDVYMQTLQNFVDAQPLGSIHIHPFTFSSPLPIGTNSNFQMTTVGTTVTFKMTVSGFTMTVTALLAGGALAPGLMIFSPAQDAICGTYITQQVSGTPGGIGVYTLSNTVASDPNGTSYQWTMLVPSNGQGLTYYNWTTAHA